MVATPKFDKKPEVKLVSTEDGWDGVYIDGKLVYQNHGLSARDLVRILKNHKLLDVDFNRGGLEGASSQRVEESGTFPSSLAEIEALVTWSLR